MLRRNATASMARCCAPLKLAGTRISELLDRLPQVLVLKSGEVSSRFASSNFASVQPKARLRAARSMPPVISTIVMLRLFDVLAGGKVVGPHL